MTASLGCTQELMGELIALGYDANATHAGGEEWAVTIAAGNGVWVASAAGSLAWFTSAAGYMTDGHDAAWGEYYPMDPDADWPDPASVALWIAGLFPHLATQELDGLTVPRQATQRPSAPARARAHAARAIAQDARDAGYKVGLLKDSTEPGWWSRIQGHRFGNRYAVSIYRDNNGELFEVARLVWSYVNADRTLGSALSFAGLRAGDRFVDQHGTYYVRAALGLPTAGVPIP